MTFDDLRALADKFFEWPEGSGRQTVTTFSTLLFAQHVLQLREKSLGTENSAGMDALRDAAQQALEALEWHLDCGTWGADLDGCAAALRAALEQQAEPEPVAWMCPDDPERETAFHWQAGHCENCGKQHHPSTPPRHSASR